MCKKQKKTIKKEKKETKVIENEKLQEESHRARVLTLSREFPFFAHASALTYVLVSACKLHLFSSSLFWKT